MVRKRVETVMEWLTRVVTKPRSELTRWQAAVRYAYDLGRYGAKQLHEDRAAQMAAALTFRTLFAIFPVAVVSTVIFQGLRGVDRFEELVEEVIGAAGLADVQVTPVTPENGAVATEVTVPEEETVTLGAWLRQLVGHAAEVDLGTLGWLGFAVLIYAALAMMVTIEESCNIIYRAPQGRSWFRRVPVYWTVLTVSPAALGLLFYLDGRVAEWFETVHIWAWLLTTFRLTWSVGIIWALLFGLYTLIPNTQVAWRAAAAGSFIGAIGLIVGKEILGQYVATFLTLRYVFGSLGFVPVFMFWLYLMWHVVLFGLEVSATLQMVGGRKLEEMEKKAPHHAVFDPASILLVMEVVGERFSDGRSTTTRQISELTAIPEATIVQMIEPLAKAGLIHRLGGEDCAISLARPPQHITADQLMEIGFSLTGGQDRVRRSELMMRLREAQRELASRATLAELVEAKNHPEGPKSERNQDS